MWFVRPTADYQTGSGAILRPLRLGHLARSLAPGLATTDPVSRKSDGFVDEKSYQYVKTGAARKCAGPAPPVHRSPTFYSEGRGPVF